MIKSYTDWYKVIWYFHKKTICYHIYSSTYEIHAQMILPEQVSVAIEDDNNELIWLPYVKNLRHIRHIRSEKYKRMREDMKYNIITNVPSLNIIHIRNWDICGKQHEIETNRLSDLSTVRAYGIISTTNNLMCKYEYSRHPTHIWIGPNTSTSDITEKKWTYRIQMVSTTIFSFHGLSMRKYI